MKKLIFYLFSSLLLISCKTDHYRVEIDHVKYSRSAIIAIEKDKVQEHSTSHTILDSKDSKKFYKEYLNRFSTKKDSLPYDSVDIDFRTRVVIFKNDSIIEELFLGKISTIVDKNNIGICDKKFKKYILNKIPESDFLGIKK